MVGSKFELQDLIALAAWLTNWKKKSFGNASDLDNTNLVQEESQVEIIIICQIIFLKK